MVDSCSIKIVFFYEWIFLFQTNCSIFMGQKLNLSTIEWWNECCVVTRYLDLFMIFYWILASYHPIGNPNKRHRQTFSWVLLMKYNLLIFHHNTMGNPNNLGLSPYLTSQLTHTDSAPWSFQSHGGGHYWYQPSWNLSPPPRYSQNRTSAS